jgi:hypothetical protein
MSVNLYVCKLEPINLFNLPMALLHEAICDQLYQSCKCSVTADGDIHIDIGAFAQTQTDNPDKKFRYIDWTTSIIDLKRQITDAQLHEKIIIFGTYRQDQIDYLKKQFGNTIITIGSEYRENSYPILLTMLAKKHLALMAAGQVPITEYDRKILNTESNDQIIQHYARAFDSQQLLARANTDNCELVIPIDDFYDTSLMIQHLSRLNVGNLTLAKNFHECWLSKQPNLIKIC